MCCAVPPREQCALEIHNQEAGPSQGPSEQFVLDSALKIEDPALVMAVVPL